MSVWRAVLRSPRGRVFLLAVACYCAWQGWLTIRAPAKLAPGLAPGRGVVDVVVTLPFPPERFHVLALQKFGRVSGTAGHRLELRGVPASDLPAVARPYWVTRVEPLSR